MRVRVRVRVRVRARGCVCVCVLRRIVFFLSRTLFCDCPATESFTYISFDKWMNRSVVWYVWFLNEIDFKMNSTPKDL